jgi:hypothetical protein
MSCETEYPTIIRSRENKAQETPVNAGLKLRSYSLCLQTIFHDQKYRKRLHCTLGIVWAYLTNAFRGRMFGFKKGRSTECCHSLFSWTIVVKSIKHKKMKNITHRRRNKNYVRSFAWSASREEADSKTGVVGRIILKLILVKLFVQI